MDKDQQAILEDIGPTEYYMVVSEVIEIGERKITTYKNFTSSDAYMYFRGIKGRAYAKQETLQWIKENEKTLKTRELDVEIPHEPHPSDLGPTEYYVLRDPLYMWETDKDLIQTDYMAYRYHYLLGGSNKRALAKVEEWKKRQCGSPQIASTKTVNLFLQHSE